MSADLEEAAKGADMCCASCGIAEVDHIKLTKCDACELVQYCSDNCQQEHRPKHERACEKRVAELRDEILFSQPDSNYLGDCPICFLPLSIDLDKSSMQSCCSKIICKGCAYANWTREMEESLDETCPFCRHSMPKTDEEFDRNNMKRVQVNDPVALREVGKKHCFEGDYDTAIKYWTKAAELGDAEAHYQLSNLYHIRRGFEKDEKMELHHLEEAAIAGHPEARYNLACYEGRNNRIDRAVRHLIIAANLGLDESLQMLKQYYAGGVVSKEDFAAALRAHHAAVHATKSPQRELAETARDE